jgi:hypothetical protein
MEAVYYVFWASDRDTSRYNRRARDPHLVIESSLATFGKVDQKLWSYSNNFWKNRPQQLTYLAQKLKFSTIVVVALLRCGLLLFCSNRCS